MPDDLVVDTAEALFHSHRYAGWREYDPDDARSLWGNTFVEGSQAGSEWRGVTATFLRGLPRILEKHYGSMPIYDQHGNVVRRIIPVPIPEEK